MHMMGMRGYHEHSRIPVTQPIECLANNLRHHEGTRRLGSGLSWPVVCVPEADEELEPRRHLVAAILESLEHDIVPRVADGDELQGGRSHRT